MINMTILNFKLIKMSSLLLFKRICQLSYETFSIFKNRTLPLLKSSIKGFAKANGRNNTGKITCRHRGGGHKRVYRSVNLLNQNFDINGIVTSIEYDPNRSCYVASLFDYNKKTFFYKIAYSNCVIGDIVKSGTYAELYIGHELPLADIPEGTTIYNVSNNSSNLKRYSRAAGTYAVLLEKTKTHCNIKLPSGKNKKLLLKNIATIGTVSNRISSTLFKKKAGRSRWLNIRPTVRGVAMNPIDHPHGGGEGKKSGNKYTPWGRNSSISKKVNKTYKYG